MLVVATSWSVGEPLGTRTPSGAVYNICYYRDDLDKNSEQEFNKDTRWVYRDSYNKPYNYPYYDDEHSKAASCTGTSMAWLVKTFRLPKETSGPISLLESYGTKFGDYK